MNLSMENRDNKMKLVIKSFYDFLLKIDKPHVQQGYWKHDLQYKWTLWYLDNDQIMPWPTKQNRIATFSTAEDFWTLHNFILPPSELQRGCDYSLFRQGILPMWEDPANLAGGRWIFLLSSKDTELLNDAWLDLCLLAIGDVFAFSDHVCGVVVNVRYKYNKISVWTADVDNMEANFEIGQKLRDMFGLGPRCLQYQKHRDSLLNKNGRYDPMYVL